MGFIVKAGIIGLLLSLGASYYIYSKISEIPETPVLDEVWWGKGSPGKEDTAIKPFKIDISKDILDDLKHRLNNALPFQPPLEGAKQHYGMNSNLLSNIVDYWKNTYNWTERQKFLNQYPQYTTSIQGLNIHYIHVKPTIPKSSNVKVLPLLIIHGWPGSVREFYEIIPLLTTPQKGRNFVFEVIAPSLPGYGFSEATNKPGLSATRMAQIFKNLMKRIGYEKYYIQGGDWGALIVSLMSLLYPENVLGAHSNMCVCDSNICHLKNFLVGTMYPSLVATEEEMPHYAPVPSKMAYLILESGYMHIQSTKPDTVGTALRDSPVGLAAYIIEKFTTWTNPAWKDLEDGGLTKRYTMDQLLDNVMIYWVTRSITTSQRLYSEMFNKEVFSQKLQEIPVTVPTGCARFSHDITVHPESLLRHKYHNLVHLSLYEDGGHFAALELPKVLAEDIYETVEKII
ncbi:juvenile hormone epoxide hydrolase 2-like [Anthonomus grandis grandis]|uniref:juvenile hormone epoxide hydrolase 2-like n=1 Tax=Anthonomus grandis grandis TaxID=2921223 RepID=UPI002166285D|nr:juvenile hormone epoxide hydrolase 2-like [Anthonomus grandis grandis]